ncbi:hypothetical protein [Nostoc sp. NZL]|uniref:hypothetical protein n=1 Tax=Nostoc sp. NZL TaxID=2650612 RepID=UPI0018C58D4B|nr:hypothetical protein [Nostoc sp. NZL]
MLTLPALLYERLRPKRSYAAGLITELRYHRRHRYQYYQGFGKIREKSSPKRPLKAICAA